jgi:hypothetical protein
VITFRKYLKAYLKPYHLADDDLLELLKCQDPNQLRQMLEVIFTSL